jgi:transposase
MVAIIMAGIQGLIIYWLLQFLYDILLTVHLGGTLGKIAVGIQIRQEENPSAKIGFGQAIARYFIKNLVSTGLLMLGYIWVAWDPKKQSWHDRIARTVVVLVNAEVEKEYTPPPPPPPPPPGGKKVGILTITKGTSKGRAYDVRLPRTLIGSDSECDIVLDNDYHYVSRKHCEIYSKGQDVYIRHLSNTNPTKVNHSRVTDQRLRDNDVIEVCDFELRLRLL